MRRQTQTSRHTTRLPTVARHMTMTRKLALMIVIGPQGECGASSFLAIVLLEFSAVT